jgi:RNA polymerase sigma-70 factor (ECF subfamily)
MPSTDFEQIVTQYYEQLYRFAYSLAGTEADACDLTQQTFYIWATKGHQLRDLSKVKSWLFTTLHREFMGLRKKAARFPQVELSDSSEELTAMPPERFSRLDVSRVVECLGQIHEAYRAAVSLFYLQECSYTEIAETLQVPLGTVRSRISRGLKQLQKVILDATKTSKPAVTESPTDFHSRQ